MLKASLLAGFLVLSAGAAAQSQLPSAQHAQRPPAKALPAEKSKDEPDAAASLQESNRQLAKSTGDLAASAELLFDAAGLLALVAGGLVVVGFLQVRGAKAAVAAAVKAANAAEAQAALVASLADGFAKQNATGRLDFLAAHRPRISVRAFRPHIEEMTDTNRYLVEFVYLNEGATPAHIKEIGTTVFSGAGVAAYGAQKPRFEIEARTPTLAGGQIERGLTKSRSPMIEIATDPGAQRGVNWYCVGYIKYRGDGDTFDRMTGFCRRWDFKTMTWEREANEEYEYAY